MNRLTLIIFGLTLSLCAQHACGQHLHILLVADSNDNKIGDSVLTDAANMASILQEGLDESSYTLTEILHDQVTSQNIIRAIQNLTIKPKDSILFYYSGHGAFDRTSSDHFLTLGDGDVLARGDIKTEILNHNPGLTVLITDCCANIVSFPRELPGVGAGMGMELEAKADGYPVLRELFFNTKGLVDITSSRPGQYSLGFGDGGVFTNALLETIEENSHASLNWYELFAKSRARASADFEFHDQMYRAKHAKGIADQQGTQTAWTFETMYGVNPNDQRLGLFMNLDEPGVITQVTQGSVAQVAGLEAGDRILSVNAKNFNTTAEAIKMVGNSKRDMRLVVECVRTGKQFQFDLKLPY